MFKHGKRKSHTYIPVCLLALLLLLTLLQHADLDHADEDVEEVELQRDGLIDRIALHDASLRKTSMVQHLLHVIEREAAKDGQSTIQPDLLRVGQGAGGGRGDDERGEAGGGDDGGTGEEGTADVEVLLLLGRGAHDGEGAHHGDGVEAGAGEDGGRAEGEEGGDKGGLGGVEGCPHGVLGNIAVPMSQ